MARLNLHSSETAQLANVLNSNNHVNVSLMLNMGVENEITPSTFLINGRRVVPVRGIFFFTGNEIYLDFIPYLFAGCPKAGLNPVIKAFSIQKDTIIPVSKSVWSDIFYRHKTLTEKFKKEARTYSEWQADALIELPPVYVWADELELALSKIYESSEWQQLRAEKCPEYAGEHADESCMEINYEQYLHPKIAKIVLEGVAHAISCFSNVVDEFTPVENCDLNARPLGRQIAQENEIKNTLNKLAIDLLALPPNQAGKAGVKSEVRKAVGNAEIWTGETVFDKAWERLLQSKEIQYRC
ncbi:hypothetical protein [uncultured Deefgea sp.]|uniref:hypothetical protein n=1 Tax=uncultured Deefgea sp. TaxID=1304914 RepID=UPI00260E8FFA|nr:hypothetical protein [uncultured Deefgea sp.]